MSRNPIDGPVNESLAPLLSAARVLIVAGKGGVGKTTVTALLARAAAAAGKRVLVVELDGKPVLATLVGDVPSLTVSAPVALEEYLREHGFGRVAKRLSASGVIDVVSTAAPGIDDIVVLGRIKQLERSGEWDLVIVDGPAAGHAVTMLTSAAGLRDAVTGGPIRAQADDVFALLHDAERCQVILVTMAETTPVSEAIETADALRHRVGVTVAGIVVNAVDTGEALDPAAAGTDDVLASAAHFRLARRAMQDQAIARLSDELPIAQWWVPLVGAIGDGERAIDELAARVTPRP